MATSDDLKKAMAAVSASYETLKPFYREVAALFAVVDDELSKQDSAVRFVPLNESALIATTGSFPINYPDRWLSTWFGRFYLEESILTDEENQSKPHDYSGVGAHESAFVFLVIASDEIEDFNGPECWFGVASADMKDSRARAWDATRNGVWEAFEDKQVGSVAKKQWFDGSFKATKALNAGGRWSCRRVELSELTDVERLIELVVNPLRNRFVEVFRSAHP